MAMTDVEKIIFGKWLKEERLKKGITQQDLAAQTCISTGSIRNIESGKANAIGKKIENTLRNFFADNIVMQLNSNGSIAKIVQPALKKNDFQSIDIRKALLQKIAISLCEDNFFEKVDAVSELLKTSKKDSIVILLENALKQNN